MPGLLDDVDPGDAADQRLDALVGEGQALHPVEDLLAEEGAGEGAGGGGDGLQDPREVVVEAGDRVLGGSGLLDHAGEHHRVAALVGDLGERVADVLAGQGLVVDVSDHELHEDDLEPDAERAERRRLVAGEVDALLLPHLLPQRGVVEGEQFRRPVVLALDRRGVPVEFLVGVEGVLGRGFEQSLGYLLAVLEQAEGVLERGSFGHGRHGFGHLVVELPAVTSYETACQQGRQSLAHDLLTPCLPTCDAANCPVPQGST